MSRSLTFFSNRDNEQDVVLLSDGVPVDPSSISRVVVDVDGTTLVDSQVDPTFFQWPVAGTYKGQAVQVIRLLLGASGAPVGEYPAGRLLIYDPDHTNGLVWAEDVLISIKT